MMVRRLPQLESPSANHAEFVICDHTIDITYIRFRLSFIYLAVILDVYTRMVRGWCVHPTLEQMLSLNALRQALRGGKPEIHHSDQGIHYAAPAYVALLQQHGVQVSMAAKGCPEENGYAERLMRTIKVVP
jgi:putative transposase